MPKIQILFDASQFDTFRLCEARFDYRYNKNKSLPTKARQLDRGTLVHIAAELYYEALKNGVKYQDAVNEALMAVKSAGVTNSDLEPDEIMQIVDVMEEYFDFWRTADQGFRIEHVEEPFIYLLHEDDDIKLHMSGKIDLIISDNKYTNLPYDHKSYERKFETHGMSNQFKNYCYATQSNLLIVNKIGFQKTLKAHEKFLRVPISYDPIILEEWKQNVIKCMFHYIQCSADNSWPMNETSCDKYNRRCEYFDICSSSGQKAKLYKLATNYIDVEPWDVSKVLAKSSKALESGEGNQ